MLSNFMLVGRLAGRPEIRIGDDRDDVFIRVMVRKPFANDEGVAEEECVEICLWRGMADECAEVLKEGDIIAVKGRIGGSGKADAEGSHSPCLIGEKVSYI